MKRISVSRTLRALSLMTMLSIVVGTTVQQSVQAQTRTQPRTAQTRSQNRTQSQAPVRCVQPKGFFVEFQGIKFTPRQEAAFRRISADMSKKAAEQIKNVRSEPIPNAPIDYSPKEGVQVSNKIFEEVAKAQTAMSRAKIPSSEQLRLLNEKFGQQVAFRQATRLRFTPQQIAAKEKMNRDFEAQMMSIFTPQQQKVYRANLVIKRQIEACDTDKSDG